MTKTSQEPGKPKEIEVLVDDLKYTNERVNYLIEELNNLSKSFDSTVEKDYKGLENTVAQLNKVGMVLHKIPDELSKQLSKSAPLVASEVINLLNQNLTSEFERNIHICYEKLNQFSQTIDSLTSEMRRLQENRFKKGMLNLFIIILISTLSSAAITYYVIKKFPQNIRIDHTGNINVEHSQVEVWKSTVNTGRDIKIKKR